MPGHTRHTATIAAPFGSLKLEADDAKLLGVSLQPSADGLLKPASPLLQEAARQFDAYFQDPHWRFTLALPAAGTVYQQRVWQAMSAIPPGAAKSYAQLAEELQSGPRAVASACRANSFPLLIPCHRVVASHGLGGYCGATQGPFLAIKRWLLRHEGYGHT
ncbi:MAG: methylated-DNA--[protein]-cysteine S-methyltransferase [Candidatus Methylumidiphilus sp.]